MKSGREAPYAQAMRRAINRMGGRFNMFKLLADLNLHEKLEDVRRWTSHGYLGSQVQHWRENGLLQLVPGEGRTFEVLPSWTKESGQRRTTALPGEGFSREGAKEAK